MRRIFLRKAVLAFLLVPVAALADEPSDATASGLPPEDGRAQAAMLTVAHTETAFSGNATWRATRDRSLCRISSGA